MTKSSKDKGNAWELELAKILEDNFEGKFSRTPRSGAIFGGSNAEKAEGEREDVVEILSGDLITPKDFPFLVEAKHYEDFKFSQVINGQNKEFDGWIDQASTDAGRCSKLPMIFCKINYIGIYCIFEYKILSLDNGICPTTYFSNHLIYKRKWIMISMETFLNYKNIIVDMARLKS